VPYSNFVFTFPYVTTVSIFLDWRTERQLVAMQHLELQTDHAWCMCQGPEVWGKNTFSFLPRLPAVRSICVLDGGNMYAESLQKGSLRMSAGYIRIWAPGVDVSARDSKGAWQLDL